MVACSKSVCHIFLLRKLNVQSLCYKSTVFCSMEHKRGVACIFKCAITSIQCNVYIKYFLSILAPGNMIIYRAL